MGSRTYNTNHNIENGSLNFLKQNSISNEWYSIHSAFQHIVSLSQPHPPNRFSSHYCQPTWGHLCTHQGSGGSKQQVVSGLSVHDPCKYQQGVPFTFQQTIIRDVLCNNCTQSEQMEVPLEWSVSFSLHASTSSYLERFRVLMHRHNQICWRLAKFITHGAPSPKNCLFS